MRFRSFFAVILAGLVFVAVAAAGQAEREVPRTLNQKAEGYRGIWYYNQKTGDRYVYKYSGGLGTYCAKHKPFAVYCEEVNKAFFCYGGARNGDRQLVHMVSYYDHETGKVPRPTILLDKKTSDAHDNPVISVDDEGYVWIFSTAHGTARPSYIHRSKEPYSVDEFEFVPATKDTADGRESMTNFSYMQPWWVPGEGFQCFFTRYGWGADRAICFMSSADGRDWSRWQRLATIDRGHYQVSTATPEKAATAFNYHPKPKGLNWRTNLYYLETTDGGETWQNAAGETLEVPLQEAHNPALVHDFEKDGLKVYMKDIRLDERGRPVILCLTSKGWHPGPQNGPHTWRTARWTGQDWQVRRAMTSDNNYDMGSIYLEDDGTWRIIGPTETGPQPYNPGGEIAVWVSRDQGVLWQKVKQLTQDSERNHTYVRRPVNAHPDFYALWADGHGREPSASYLYFCDKSGTGRQLPRKMDDDFSRPEPVN